VTANWAPWWVPKWAMSMSESTCSYMRMYASLPTTVYSTRVGNRMSWYAAGNQCVTPITSNTESRNQSLWLDATTPFTMMVPPSVDGLYTPCFTTVSMRFTTYTAAIVSFSSSASACAHIRSPISMSSARLYKTFDPGITHPHTHAYNVSFWLSSDQLSQFE
jgi:hypothetical protein